MPHAETMGSAPTINGDLPSSLFFSHFTSYPAISDVISAFKSNPYGQKSLGLADKGYVTFFKPVQGYLAGPYSIVAPYVSKADSLGDKGLSKVDSTFPIIKEPTDKIKGTVTDVAFFPLKVAGDGKEYVFKVYGDEHKRQGPGLVGGAKALVTTGLVVTADSLGWIGSFLGQKKEEAKKTVDDKTQNL